MICPNCKAQLEEGTAFCPNCGAPVGKQLLKSRYSAGKKKTLLLLTLIGAVCIAVTVTLFLLLTGGKKGFKTPEEAATKFLIAFSSHDAEKYLDSIPDFIANHYARNEGIQEGDRAALLRRMKEDEQWDLGIVPVKVDHAEIYEDPETYAKSMKYIAHYNPTADDLAQIEAFCLVKVSGTSTQGKTGSAVIPCVKIDGRWYAVDPY